MNSKVSFDYLMKMRFYICSFVHINLLPNFSVLMLMELPSVSRDVAEKVDNQLTVPDFLSVDPFMLLVCQCWDDSMA